MASYNRVSLDTDVILLRKIFAFGDGETPVPANTILAAAPVGSGQVAFTSVTDVLDATCLPTSANLPIIFEDIYGKIEGINTDLISGGVSNATFNATVTNLEAATAAAATAYVAPLAAQRAATDLSFADVNARLTAITADISQTPWQLIADLSGTVAGLGADLADLTTFTYSLADTTTNAIIALDASLAAIVADNAAYTAAISEDLSGVLSAVDAKIAQLQSGTSTTPTTFTAQVTMKEPLVIDVSGTATAPAITFTRPEEFASLGSATGIYHPEDGKLAISCNGIPTFSTTQFTTTIANTTDIGGRLQVYQAGTAASPAISFVSATDTDTGIYHPADNRLVIGVGGQPALDMTATQVIVGKQLVIDTAGSAGNAALLFGKPYQSGTTFDADTGIYHPTDGKLVLTCNNTDALAATSAEVVVRGLAVTTNACQIDTRINIRVPPASVSAADPAIHFREPTGASTGTGIYRSSANSLCLAAGSTDRLVVTPTGIRFPQNTYYSYKIPQQSVNSASGADINRGWPNGTYVGNLEPTNLGGSVNAGIVALFDTYVAALTNISSIPRAGWICPASGLWQISLSCTDDSKRSDHIVIGNYTRNTPYCSNKSSATVYIDSGDTLLITGNYGGTYFLEGFVTMTLLMPMGISMTVANNYTTPTAAITSTTLPSMPAAP